jgi:type IX secretion system PorP/SprF family membrane protein
MKWLSIAFILLLIYPLNDLRGQMIHFSQAYGTHLTLNPANTGRFNGDWRLAISHRQQGVELSNDYQTSYISYEHPVYVKAQKLDMGFYFSHDNSSLNTFPVNRFNFSLAHGLMLTYKLRMHLGIQGAYINKRIEPGVYSYPDQYNRDNGKFDPTLPTGEVFVTEHLSYVDIGWGMLLTYNLKRGLLSLGYSTQQLNHPEETFVGITSQLPLKHVVHMKADVSLGRSFFVIPSMVYLKQQRSEETLIGMNIGYQLNEWLNEKNSVIAGVHYRFDIDNPTKTLIVSSGFSWRYWSLMASFDTGLLKDQTANVYSNALEIGLVYKLPSTKLTRQIIPCERY